MEKSISAKVKYLDTSAIVKLYLDEEDSSRFRDYFNNHSNFCTALFTFYESMNVLKSKLFKKDKNKYYKAIEDLEIHGWGEKIEIENINLSNIEIFKEINKLSIEHNLDIADAVQIYAILNGKYSYFNKDSASVLITADNDQEECAGKNGIRVWNCSKEPKPDWLDN